MQFVEVRRGGRPYLHIPTLQALGALGTLNENLLNAEPLAYVAPRSCDFPFGIGLDESRQPRRE
jgi:hypothetical protein